jgi:tRNA1(Val) A37 N6-methylase TrmN6
VLNTSVATSSSPAATTDGTLLGGRVSYRQFRDGYRTGIEPVLLAATIPAQPGLRVLEAGCGAGAGLLCLSARIRDVRGTGIEQDPATAALARHNLDANGCASWPIATGTLDTASAQLAAASYDHAIANPPWHRAGSSASPSTRRDLAKRAPSGTLSSWSVCLVRLLRSGGTLTLILPAAQHAEAASAMQANGLGAIRLLPLWPVAGRPARIVLIQGTLGGQGDGAVLPGLVLHHPGGGYTAEADLILREAAALPFT